MEQTIENVKDRLRQANLAYDSIRRDLDILQKKYEIAKNALRFYSGGDNWAGDNPIIRADYGQRAWLALEELAKI